MSDTHDKEVDSVTGTATTGHEWDGIKELNLSEKLRAVDIAQLVARAAGLDENPLGAGEPETAKR